MYHAAWEVGELTDLARARRRLIEVGSLVGQSDHGVSLSLYAKDPDGLEFELFWTVPGGSRWARARSTWTPSWPAAGSGSNRSRARRVGPGARPGGAGGHPSPSIPHSVPDGPPRRPAWRPARPFLRVPFVRARAVRESFGGLG